MAKRPAYAAIMKTSLWAKLIIPSTPNTIVYPSATSAIIAPSTTPVTSAPPIARAPTCEATTSGATPAVGAFAVAFICEK
jgi:hypothetical protein